jgi:hypothetical protein
LVDDEDDDDGDGDVVFSVVPAPADAAVVDDSGLSK